jgi:hypothetical protein
VRGEYEFLVGGHWWQPGVGTHRRKIWNDPEHTLGLLTFGIVLLVLRRRRLVRYRNRTASRLRRGIKIPIVAANVGRVLLAAFLARAFGKALCLCE